MAAKDNDDVYVNDLYRCQEVRQPDFSQFMKHVSCSLYWMLSYDLGSENIIRMRRQMTELQNEYFSLSHSFCNSEWHNCLSGSISEGFRFSSSDVDYMMTNCLIHVMDVQEYKSVTNGNQLGTTLLLMECDKTRPGFALLRLVGNAYDIDVQRSLVPYKTGIYVSSQVWRDENSFRLPSATTHGPCNSGILGGTEYDHALCLHSSIWPKAAYGCIDQLRRCNWLTCEELRDIVRGGVHFVPIGSKESQIEFLEWRMSFSVAEKKIIHAMNHTQFMCYGLLKIFLKEAINNIEELKSILCSYFLKTTVFWEILNPSVHWVPHQLLLCFWQCFSQLISWIHQEYLPNFFIPENNMLHGKFQPGKKRLLMDHLKMLYSEGYACLLRCPSLCNVLTVVIQRPRDMNFLLFNTLDFMKCKIDNERIREIGNIAPSGGNLLILFHLLEVVKYLLHVYDGHCNAEVLGLSWRRVLSALMMKYFSTLDRSYPLNNKDYYQICRKLFTTISRCAIDSTLHHIETAVCLYRCKMYEDVIKISNIAITRLQNPYLMYQGNNDIEKYKAAGGEYVPYQVMLRKHFAGIVVLTSTTCMPELRLELLVAREHDKDCLKFPPLVIARFLQCLSNHRLGNHGLVQEAVDDLYALMYYDDGFHVTKSNRAVSWQILGICQEMIHDYLGAVQSYSNALHDQYSEIRPASLTRLENLI